MTGPHQSNRRRVLPRLINGPANLLLVAATRWQFPTKKLHSAETLSELLLFQTCWFDRRLLGRMSCWLAKTSKKGSNQLPTLEFWHLCEIVGLPVVMSWAKFCLAMFLQVGAYG